MSNHLRKLLDSGHQAIYDGKYSSAETTLKKAFKFQSNNFECVYMLGLACQGQRKFQDAIEYFERAIALDPEHYVANFNLAKVMMEQGKHADALPYHIKAVQLSPTRPEAWLNFGKSMFSLRRQTDALICFQAAYGVKKDCAEAYIEEGIALEALGMKAEALAAFESALEINPDYLIAEKNAGQLLIELKRSDEALQRFEHVFEKQPDFDLLAGMLIYAKMNMADWSKIDAYFEKGVAGLKAGKMLIHPFVLLSLLDSPKLQLDAATMFVRDRSAARHELPPFSKNPHDKIRIGYFSADFRQHPVSTLTAELFELHDRSRFEIYGFSLKSAPPDDTVRGRLVEAFDHFILAENNSDLDIAKLARELEIDIAVDLGGYTSSSRAGIFECRAAPVQVSYLGYPATTGAPYMDYVIADKILIPQEQRAFYSEKIAYMPNCFQSNDSTRPISRKVFTRTEVGLPETGFVFCCFNNNHKLNPSMFDSWMRILQQVDGASLWLLANIPQAETYLRQEAEARGVDPARLVFGGRIAAPEYLARYRTADLFLDTLPFNAGTTASDALWAGLPVLTQMGQSFAGRMAGSLLHAIDLPELVTASREEYEALAIELARDADKMDRIRQKLAANRRSAPLYDSAQFASHLEDAFSQMHERARADLPPEHIHVRDIELN